MVRSHNDFMCNCLGPHPSSTKMCLYIGVDFPKGNSTKIVKEVHNVANEIKNLLFFFLTINDTRVSRGHKPYGCEVCLTRLNVQKYIDSDTPDRFVLTFLNFLCTLYT